MHPGKRNAHTESRDNHRWRSSGFKLTVGRTFKNPAWSDRLPAGNVQAELVKLDN